MPFCTCDLCEEVGETVGRTHHGWMNGRDVYTCILLGGNGRDNQTMTEDITHTYIFNKVLLRGEVVDMAANGQ